MLNKIWETLGGRWQIGHPPCRMRRLVLILSDLRNGKGLSSALSNRLCAALEGFHDNVYVTIAGSAQISTRHAVRN